MNETQQYYTYIQDDIIVIQKEKYLQHGWFVHIESDIISLKEIPYGGGQEIYVNTFSSIIEAIKAGEQLT